MSGARQPLEPPYSTHKQYRIATLDNPDGNTTRVRYVRSIPGNPTQYVFRPNQPNETFPNRITVLSPTHGHNLIIIGDRNVGGSRHSATRKRRRSSTTRTVRRHRGV